MLHVSYRGRRRRPSQQQKVLATGVTGVAVTAGAVGMAGSASADAADDSGSAASRADTRSSPPDRDYYVVRSGDTLSGIASRYGIDGGWQTLHEANGDLLDDPDLIMPGQRLRLP